MALQPARIRSDRFIEAAQAAAGGAVARISVRGRKHRA